MSDLHAASGLDLCRLCLGMHRLVQSHIIPDFQFKELKRGDGFFYTLSADPKDKERKLQRGFTERLLCAKCDNERMQRNEDYFARMWSRGHLPNTTKTKCFLIFRDHDYKRSKNFLLSVLWRMSVSSLEIFREVSLGKKHEEILRTGLLSDREFDEDEYPIMITAPFIEGEFHRDLILQPSVSRMEGNRTYRCVIAGLLYTYFVGSASCSPVVKAMSLRRAEMPIARLDAHEIPFFAQAIHKLGQANAIRALSGSS